MDKGYASLDSTIFGGDYYIALYQKFFKDGLPKPGEKNILADGSPAVSTDAGLFGDRVYSAMGMERILVYGDGA